MRVLVTAATRHDATQEIAAAIGAGLTRREVDADVREITTIRDLEGYDAVVLGSAVYVGRWMRPALGFVATHRAALRARPVWLFSSGPLGPPTQPVPVTDPADLAEVVEMSGARAHRLFPGRLDRERLGAAERMLVRAAGAPYGDERDWEAIDAYAAEIAACLATP